MSSKFFDIKKRIDPSPPPLPDFLMPKPTDSPRTLKKKKILAKFLYISVLVVGTGTAVLIARADYTKFYPQNCAGTWENSAIISENIKNPENLDSIPFDAANSAVLRKEKDKEIICNSFSGDEVNGKILSLKLNMLWNFGEINVAPSNTPKAVEVPTEESETTTNDLPITPSTNTQTKNNEQTENLDNIQPTDNSETPTPEDSNTETTTSIVAPDEIEQSSQEQQIPPESAPEVVPTEPIAPPETTEASDSAIPFIKSANAQESPEEPKITASLVFNGIEHFLEIDYSFDGQNWLPVNNADLQIPADNLSDIQNLQIKVTSRREGQDLPNVYLKAMYLEAKFLPENADSDPEVIVEETSESQENQSILDSITDAISDTADNLVEAITPSEKNHDPKISELSQLYEAPKKPEWNFTVHQEVSGGSANILTSVKNLFSSDEPIAKSTSNSYTLSLSSNQRAITIDGSCSKKYYTILLFTSPDDFIQDPSRAVINRANECRSGRFTFTLEGEVIPASAQSGKYYLVVGEQDEKQKIETNNQQQELEITRIQ